MASARVTKTIRSVEDFSTSYFLPHGMTVTLENPPQFSKGAGLSDVVPRARSLAVSWAPVEVRVTCLYKLFC